MIRERFLTVKGQTFDIQTLRADIESVAHCFGEYLSRVGAGSGTKHRALGAVGKALQRARNTRGEALFGYARRVHEQSTGSGFPADAAVNLDAGLKQLDDLLRRQAIPPRAHPEILSAIEYATYYDVKRRFVEFQHTWKRYVQQHGEQLGLGKLSEEQIPWFSRKKLAAKGEQWEKASKEFLATLKEPAPETDIDEED
jgi:hypothetical protein